MGKIVVAIPMNEKVWADLSIQCEKHKESCKYPKTCPFMAPETAVAELIKERIVDNRINELISSKAAEAVEAKAHGIMGLVPIGMEDIDAVTAEYEDDGDNC